MKVACQTDASHALSDKLQRSVVCKPSQSVLVRRVGAGPGDEMVSDDPETEPFQVQTDGRLSRPRFYFCSTFVGRVSFPIRAGSKAIPSSSRSLRHSTHTQTQVTNRVLTFFNGSTSRYPTATAGCWRTTRS